MAIQTRWYRASLALVAFALVGCAGVPTRTASGLGASLSSPVAATNGPERAIFDTYLARHPDLTAAQVLAMLPKRQFVEQLPFDPSTAAYYPEVTAALRMTDAEKSLLRKNGFVSVDHRRHYSVGAMYHAIYVADLPVLITTDSITHALHRSYDESLKELEAAHFSNSLGVVLAAAHRTVAREAAGVSDRELLDSARDVDLYITVARNLLSGMGALAESRPDSRPRIPANEARAVPSVLDQDDEVHEILEKIASLNPDESVRIYGGKRAVDWSQFTPRGHYTESEELRRYFRTMMWLGRSDLGWYVLSAPGETDCDTARERRDAAVMAYVLEKSGQASRLGSVSDAIDFLVGRADSLSVKEMRAVLAMIHMDHMASLADDAVAARLEQAIKQLGLGHQRIRSQSLLSDVHSDVRTPLPEVFQVFGQRFVIDSFVLSEVVFDSIAYQGRKQPRRMPKGLDVFAALGNDEAVRLLQPDLERWNYGSNLMAGRAVVDSYSPEQWSESVYNGWLHALMTLDDEPPSGAQVPQTMQTRAWRHKQLQTQLASWSELRRDSILYVKQSDSAGVSCSYPTGYVEPYPEFFGRLQAVAQSAARRFATIDVGEIPGRERGLLARRDGMVEFWNRFAAIMAQLQALATKELAAQPFTEEEQAFIKKTINMNPGGSGPPQYDGWYPSLIYGGEPEKWKPTVADVHTDPTSGTVLQEGVGDVTFLVAAIDNQGDRAVYVGPMSSWYEFPQPASRRLTDETWGEMVDRFEQPPRPQWTRSFHPQLRPPERGRDVRIPSK